MIELLENLDPLLKTFWYIALPTSLIFLIMTILSFVGGDAHDADFDSVDSHDGGSVFSIRNLINFLLGFSWTGISFYHVIPNSLLLISLSVFVGILFVYVFFILIKFIYKLSADYSFQLSDAIGKTGEVYLTIPGHQSGTGKIILSINGSIHELNAYTNDDAIPTGSIVKVMEINQQNILIVTSKND